VQVELTLDMLPDRNTVMARFRRPEGPPPVGADLPEGGGVVLAVRIDLEDRGFHMETRAGDAAEHHFRDNTLALAGRAGFLFQPAPERRLEVWSDAGSWHPQEEWLYNIPHPVEASRGMTAQGDAWSPGWFEFPLARPGAVTLTLCADPTVPTPEERRRFPQPRGTRMGKPPKDLLKDSFGLQLWEASRAFLARRGAGLTVIAGYPWFLDWGRDTFIAARGLLAGGMVEEVRGILRTFAAFEDRGTLPNMLSADSTSDRDTSDAPLWFALAVEEACMPELKPVLEAIAAGYRHGTPNGIKVDPESGLVWSPSHFTWMDTNYPAGTPRQGYPVEIQALWIRLLDQLGCTALAAQARASLELFWDEEQGWFHDHLEAAPGCPAAQAQPDGHLRPNQLFLVSLGLVTGTRAQKAVSACSRHLLVPGALRSLAPLPVLSPLPIHGPGGLLNDPMHPYWGHYEGDEDTRRKPAYHNGTAWVWLLPTFCEALARAWDGQPEAMEAARAHLGSLDALLASGCLGQLPELLDGDAPHRQRGCDAQAWSATEGLRVWLTLNGHPQRISHG
jgi:predicted glycogen debranching enzyme